MRASIILMAAAAGLAGCINAKSTAAADAAVQQFHAALNAGKSSAIYAAAGADLKAATTPQAFGALLDAVHGKLGLFKSGKSVGVNDNHTTGGEFVTVAYDATYEKGKAQESFVYRIGDNGSELVGYHVNADALVAS